MSDEYSLTMKWQRGEITTAEFRRRMARLEAAEPRSYPDAITSPNDPPSVSGTDVTKPI